MLIGLIISQVITKFEGATDEIGIPSVFNLYYEGNTPTSKGREITPEAMLAKCLDETNIYLRDAAERGVIKRPSDITPMAILDDKGMVMGYTVMLPYKDGRKVGFRIVRVTWAFQSLGR